jgi:radical SAM protein with 4Fe4S-binding SPASM domain
MDLKRISPNILMFVAMPIDYKMGRRGATQMLMYRLRRSLPASLRLRVWQRTARRVFARKGYAQQVPLFRSVELETRTRCNSTCSFCAASILTDKRPDVLMPEPLYDKLIAELASLNYDGTIKFFVNNEPLLDKRTASFIRKAKAALPFLRTEVHTNGLKLNPNSGRELLEAGLDHLYINNYSQDHQVHRGVQAFLDEVAPAFPAVEIVLHMRLLDEQLLNRGGTAPNGRAITDPLPLPCILPFDEIVVTADGRVTICCQDLYFEAAVGNLQTHRIDEIWYGEGFQKLRAALLKSDRSHNKFCAACDFKGYKEEHLTTGESLSNRAVGALLEDFAD